MNNKKILFFIRNIISMFPFIFILTIFILHIIMPDKTFSGYEQRYLVQYPILRFEELISFNYASKMESYFSDQFPFRSFWIDMRDMLDKVLFITN